MKKYVSGKLMSIAFSDICYLTFLLNSKKLFSKQTLTCL